MTALRRVGEDGGVTVQRLTVLERLKRRWHRRSVTDLRKRDLVVAAEIDVRCPANEVWAFVLLAESSVIAVDGVVRAYTEPGTPRGQVGERQCFVTELQDGTRKINRIEVRELGPGYRAVAVSLDEAVEVRSTTEVTTLEGGCQLALTYEAHVPIDAWSTFETAYQTEVRQYLRRVKHALEAGTRLHPGQQ